MSVLDEHRRKKCVRVKSVLSISAVYLLLVLVTLCVSETGATTPVRPAEVKWLFLADVDDYVFASTAKDIWAGMKAAEKFINDNNLLLGTRVNFTMLRGLNLTPSISDINQLSATVAQENPFGFILPDWVNSGYVTAITQGSSVPVVGMESTASNLFDASRKNILHLRQPFSREYLGLLNYAVDGVSLCSYSAVIVAAFDGVNEIMASLNASVMALNQPAVLNVTMEDMETFGPNSASITRSRFFRMSPKNPGCVFMFGLSMHITAWIDALWGDERLDRANTYFFATSAASASSYNSSLYGTAPYANLRISHYVTDPTSSARPSTHAYHTAFNAWAATNPDVPAEFGIALLPAEQAMTAAQSRYTYPAYDAFLTGMFIATVMRAMPNISSAEFISTVYDRKYVNIHEVMYGPFSDACLAGSSTTFPCFCNTGGRSYYITRVDTTSGLIVAATGDPTYQDASQLSITAGLEVCQLDVTDILFPLTLGMVFELGKIGFDRIPSAQMFAMAFIGAAMFANAGGYIADYGRFNPLLQVVTPQQSTDQSGYLFNLTTRYNPLALIGGTMSPGDTNIPSFFRNAIEIDLEDPPLQEPSAFSHYELYLSPVLADYIHSMVAYAADPVLGLGVTAGSSFIVAYDAAALAALAVKSLHTFQIDGMSFVDLSPGDASAVDSLSTSVVARAQGRVRTVLLIAATSETIVVRFLEALAVSATSALVSAEQQQSLTVMIATDNIKLFTAKYALRASSHTLPANLAVVFPSVISEWWIPTAEVNIYLSLFLNTTNLTVLEHPASVVGFLAATFIYNLVRGVGSAGGVTRQTLVNQVYTSGTVAAYGVTYGPFYATNCSKTILESQTVDRVCQCYKGPRTFYALSFNDWMSESSGSTNNYFYTMATCGVQYKSLEVASSLNIGMIAGIAAGVGTAVIGAFVLLGCFAVKGKRDNRVAPKDPNAPFAMMFTDIQSSTSLWARAPQQMGPCVERHHDEIRKLCKKYDGYEVKTIGDSFMIAFQDPKKAVELALAIQKVFYELEWPPEIDETYRGLAREAAEQAAEETKTPLVSAQSYFENDPNYKRNWNGLRVRVGLNFGVGSVKFDSVSQGYDYYGTLVNTAARVEGVGNGGQVLVTKSMYDELEAKGFNFSTVDVTPLGPQPLRGLDAPIPLYQLNPLHLKGRTFNALRLDVENAAEEDSGDSDGTQNSASADSDANATAEMIAERFVRSKRMNQRAAEIVLDKAHFLEVALSTSSASWQNETLSHLIKKWRAHVRRKMATETDAHYEMLRRLTLTWRLALAQDELKRANGSTGIRRRESMRLMMSNPNTPLVMQTPQIKVAGSTAFDHRGLHSPGSANAATLTSPHTAAAVGDTLEGSTSAE